MVCSRPLHRPAQRTATRPTACTSPSPIASPRSQVRFCLFPMPSVKPHCLLAMLVPVRDAAADLPGFLESAGALTDAVIALDDGSEDTSAEILADSPLVKRLLRRPRGSWDDG